jgi:hypothetical protein
MHGKIEPYEEDISKQRLFPLLKSINQEVGNLLEQEMPRSWSTNKRLNAFLNEGLSDPNFENIMDTLLNVETLINKAQPDSTEEKNVYSNFLKNIKKSCKEALDILEKQIISEIKSFQPPLVTQVEADYFQNLQTLLKNLEFQKINSLSPTKMLSIIGGELNLLHKQFAKKLMKEETRFKKEHKFYRKKILPFSETLQQTNQVSEATKDLEVILKAMIDSNDRKGPKVKCRLNSFKEVEVTINDSITYNLTQILRHEPDFARLNLNEETLDQYLALLQQNKFALKPLEPKDFPVANWEKLNSKEIIGSLNQKIEKENKKKKKGYEKNNFEHCHAAHCLAINIYTGASYTVMNKLLREKTISVDLFKKPIGEELEKIEKNLRDGKSTGEPLTEDEMSRLILETTTTIGIAAAGLNQAQHLLHHPAEETRLQRDTLDTQEGRTVRGTSGDWVSLMKNSYMMANIAGMPLYNGDFLSTTFKPKQAQYFTGLESNPDKIMISKYLPFSTSFIPTTGTDISAISAYQKTEAEYLFPPGCILLPSAESTIKHKEHYTGIKFSDKKNTVVVCDGNSYLSSLYSSRVQSERNKLINMYENLTELNNQQTDPIEKTTCKQFIDSLEKIISALKSPLKTVDLVISEKMPSLDDMDVANFCDDTTDAVFLITKEGGCLIDKETKTVQKFPIDDQNLEEMTKLLNLDFNKLVPDETSKALTKIDILKIAYLAKVANNKTLLSSCIFTGDSLLKMYAEKIAEAEDSYNTHYKESPSPRII